MKKFYAAILLPFLMVPFIARAGVMDLLKKQVDDFIESNNGFSIFTDMPLSHTNFYSISSLSINGAISGYPDGTFKPDVAVNRAELVKMIVTANYADAVEQGNYANCFPDVREEWFAKYICFALENGWVQGYPDGMFKPGNNVNRVEAIKMAVNGMVGEQHMPSPTDEQMAVPMPSDADMSAWYAGFLRFSIVMELLDGQHVTEKPDMTYQYYPSENMTRKEVAEMLFRMVAYVGEREYYAGLMGVAQCYVVLFQDETTEDELKAEIINMFEEAGYTEQEMDALTLKYQNDDYIQQKIVTVKDECLANPEDWLGKKSFQELTGGV